MMRKHGPYSAVWYNDKFPARTQGRLQVLIVIQSFTMALIFVEVLTGVGYGSNYTLTQLVWIYSKEHLTRSL